MLNWIKRSRVAVAGLAVLICGALAATAIALAGRGRTAQGRRRSHAAEDRQERAAHGAVGQAARQAGARRRHSTRTQGADGPRGLTGTNGTNGTNGTGGNGTNGTNGTNASVPSQSASVIQDVALVDQDQFPGKKVVDLETNSVGPGAVFLITNQPGRILSTAMIQLQENQFPRIQALDQLVGMHAVLSPPTDTNGNLTGTFQPFGRATNASLLAARRGSGSSC